MKAPKSSLVGKKFDFVEGYLSDEDKEFIKGSLGATRIRFRLPGSIVTMDYCPTRYNIFLSEDGVVEKIILG